MKEEISEKVKKVVAEVLGIDISKITEDASFVEDLGADSLDTVELIMALEEEFEVDIPENMAANIKTVGDVVEFIEKK
jgi:acyl carrier protein